MVTRTQVQNLINLRSVDHLIASLYLHLGADSKSHRLKIKDMIRERREELGDIPKRERRSVETDLKKMQTYVESLYEPPYQGLVIFSSASQDIWEVLLLPQPVRDLLAVDSSAYVRPLVRMLDEHRRVCTLLIDSTRARIFQIFMGEIEEQSEILSDVPPKVRDEGWSGYSGKKIERHVEFHLHTHLKRVADRVFDYFREEAFDWLFLGGNMEIVLEVENTLHTYLRERVKKTFRMDLGSPPKQVLEKTLGLAREVKQEEDRELVVRLIDSLKPAGLGVTGIDETLRSLCQGSVHTLMVEQNFSHPGRICLRCGFMALDGSSCPMCRGSLALVPDIVDEAVSRAIDQNTEVFHITPGTGLKRLGGIGALLRYTIVKQGQKGVEQESLHG